jgi:hypothetical protein
MNLIEKIKIISSVFLSHYLNTNKYNSLIINKYFLLNQKYSCHNNLQINNLEPKESCIFVSSVNNNY